MITSLTPSVFAAAPDEELNFSAACSGAGAMTYEWNPGDGSPLKITTATSVTHRYAQEGEFHPSVTCKDAQGAYAISGAMAAVHVAVPSHTVTQIQAVRRVGGGSNEVTLSATCAGQPGDVFSYRWNFGDNTPDSVGQSVTHNYPSAPSRAYTASVSCANSRAAIDRAGKPFSAPQSVSAATSVVVGLDIVAPTITAPLTIEPAVPTTAGPTTLKFSCASANSSPVVYTFNFGDGTPSVHNNTGTVAHTFTDESRRAAFQRTITAACNLGTGTTSQTQSMVASVRAPSLTLLAGQTSSPFVNPVGVAVDASGNVYVADSGAHVIRKVSPEGVVSTLAGSGAKGFVEGIGIAASFDTPTGVAVASDGTVYVADSGNHVIRKITGDRFAGTLAGSLSKQEGHVDGTGANARFKAPAHIAVDRDGVVYVADTGNVAIRKVTREGVVSTLARRLAADGSVNFIGVGPVTIDPLGLLYVADSYGETTRRVSQDGSVRRGYPLTPGHPGAIAMGRDGGPLYLADPRYMLVRELILEGRRELVAGNAADVAQRGIVDGIGQAARFRDIQGLAVDAAGNIYAADTGNQAIRKISPSGQVTTLASLIGLVNGAGASSAFHGPTGITLDALGTAYVADSQNWVIRALSATGVTRTHTGVRDFYSHTNTLVDGPASTARFQNPTGLARDTAQNLYVADTANKAIRKVSPNGDVITIAPRDLSVSNPLISPEGIAVDAAGNVFVADSSTHAIHKISTTGDMSLFAGSAVSETGSTNGALADARFDTPTALAFDREGNLYVADTGNHVVRKINTSGTVDTLAGGVKQPGFVNEQATLARFQSPRGLAVDSAGNIYVADSDNRAIRKLTPEGLVSTIVGGPAGSGTLVPGSLPGAIGRPTGIAILGRRLVFTADHYVAQVDFAP